MRKTCNKQIYDNIEMLSPEGKLMCYIGSKKADWYLKRNLAEILEEKKIKLKFRPNGLGHHCDPEKIIHVENKCVVCGETDISKLSKHHSVPECFRKYFPREWKAYRSHEILFVCIQCHEKYERIALCVKKDLIAFIGGEEIMSVDNTMRKYIKTLLENKLVLPEENKKRIENKIKNHYNIEVVNDSILKKILKKPKINIYKVYSQQIDNHYEFSKFWKQHFVDTMKPKHLFKYWTPEYEPF